MATTSPAETETLDAGGASPGKAWHRSAPAAVVRAYREGGAAKGWAAWTRHLAGRRRPVAVEELLPGRQPLGWALPEEAESRGTLALLARLDLCRSKRLPAAWAVDEAVGEWLAEAPGAAADACWSVEALAWCHGLPTLSGQIGADAWWALLDHLLQAVALANRVEPDDHPLSHQCIAGELALTLGYLLPEIRACRKAGRAGRRALSLGLVELTDGEGLLGGKHFDLLRPLIACWTRCGAVGGQLAKGSWNKAAQVQYEWLVRHALRLARHDGSHALSSDSTGDRCDDLFRAAVALGGDQDDRHIQAVALPGTKRADAARIRKAALRKAALPKPAYHSAWGAVGVLRSGWSRDDSRLVTVYDGHRCRVEVECRRNILFSGEWELAVRRDGQLLETTSAWEDLCWVSDKDVDYLELEIELSGGVRVQRHMLLAREDQFLFLADAVLGDQPAALEYRGCLPLGKGVALEAAEESWEGFLVGRNHKAALALPLALPEWRIDPRGAAMGQSDGGLELCQSARGASLFAPCFFDLKPRRMKRPFTWRQLTVAENLQIQPSDVAVGYRVMVGTRQWLIYRSLAPAANRTLLGHNLATELLVARFRPDGEVETLVEIE